LWWSSEFRPVQYPNRQPGIEHFVRRMYATKIDGPPHRTGPTLTPQEALEGQVLPEPIPIRARDQRQPEIEVRQMHWHDDPRLPVIEISVRLAA
jgi:hypothetical protein